MRRIQYQTILLYLRRKLKSGMGAGWERDGRWTRGWGGCRQCRNARQRYKYRPGPDKPLATVRQHL